MTLVVVFTLQPYLFRLFVSNRVKKGFQPIRLRSLLFSIVLLIFYGFGGMLLSLFSLIILPIIPLKKKTKNKILHKVIAWFVQAVLYGNPFVKKRVINSVNEDFTKPAIIIANHSSSLDTLTMGLVTHKAVYLVNDWVYKSPVFGGIARALGFYPVSNGVDGSIAHLKNKVDSGYSLMVFPEAKRSETNKIGRFHKGAFFLQEQLKIDILPIYFHGNAEVMPKNDLIIHDGNLTVEIGKRIAYNDEQFGLTARERNKTISTFFKNSFIKIRNKIENENYFKDILFANYRYKEAVIFKEVQIDFGKNKALYHTLNEVIPLKTTIFHIANDFGQIDILLKSKSLDRKITTFIKNNLKLKVAQNCYTTKIRKVDYLEHLETQIIENNILIISNTNLSDQVSINLAKFEQIILVNATVSPLLKGYRADKVVIISNEVNLNK